jgi:hypothetical protein
MSTRQNKAKTLTEKIWGSDFLSSLPAKWRMSLKVIRTKTPGVPNNTDPDGGGDVLDSQVVTNRTNELEKTTTELDPDIGTLVDRDTNQVKQIVTRTETFVSAGATPDTPTATKDVKFENVGAGKVIQTVEEVPSVFDSALYEKRREDTVPEKFKTSIPAVTTKHIITGTASAPTLATGDLYRSQQQITMLTYELTITNRDISSLPTLEGQKYDEELNVLIPYTEQVVAAGSALGNNATEVTPLGGGLDLVTIYDLTAIASAFATFQLVFPSKANLDLPDVLYDLELINEEHSGEGNSSTPIFSGFWSGAGSWSITPSGTATGSQAVTPELIPTIEPTYGNRKSTTRLVFLLPMPVTNADVLGKVAAIIGASVTDWPDFRPQPVHAVLTGRQISLQVHASYHVQDGGSGASNEEHSESFVRGFSTEVGMIIKTKEIGSTIHGNLGPFNPYTIASFDLTADAYYDSETQTTPAVSTSVEVRGAGSTGGQTTIPATGKHLLDSNGAPYRFNHAMIHAEVFDFADL